jgi:hypothetical protein
MLFEVAGDRVTVTPDLIALRWDVLDEGVEEVSVELVRAIGRPISRRQFGAMRERPSVCRNSGPESSRLMPRAFSLERVPSCPVR